MNNKMHIVLIEDNVKEAKIICDQLDKTMEKIREWDMSSEIGFDEIETYWIKGTDLVSKREKTYNHFKKNDYKKIVDIIKELEQKEEKIGILMDVILTKEEQDRANVNDFLKIEFSKKIMDDYEESYGIYFITGIRNFGSRALSIFGRENMEKRYIPKELVLDYPSRKSLARALYWMYNKKFMPEDLANAIEDKELEDID